MVEYNKRILTNYIESKKERMKKIRSRIFINIILLLSTFVCAMLLSCSCEGCGGFSGFGGLVELPGGISDRNTETLQNSDSFDESDLPCDHVWRELSFPEGITCLEEIDYDLNCTRWRCSGVKTVKVRGACAPEANGICKYCGKRATDISDFIFVRRAEKYYEVSLREESTAKVVVYPEHYLDLPVKKISSLGANVNVEQIFIPASVNQLGDGVFRNFDNLVSVYIGEGSILKRISKNSFYGCEKLSYVSIEKCPELIDIADAAFYGCESLVSITVPSSVTSIGSNAFTGCTKLSDIKILSDRVGYGQYTFSECESITDISFVELSDIPMGMFYGCKGLEYVEIPESVTSIGMKAFGATGLREVVLPDTDIVLNDGAFNGCVELEKINLPSGMYNMPPRLFMGCRSLKEITIPAGVQCIGTEAFYGCSSLERIILPESLMHIHASVFGECIALGSVECSDNMKAEELKIYSAAFAGCTALENVSFPTEIPVYLAEGYRAFKNCSSLREVVLPESVSSIPAQLFEGCTSLEKVSFSDSLTSIGSHAFNGCSSLVSVSSSRSLMSIGDSAFADCSSLESFEGPDREITVYSEAFENCSSLQSISLKISGEMPSRLFMGCSSLKSVEISGNAKSLGYAIFSGCGSLERIDLSGLDLEEIENEAFRNCASLVSVKLPNSVKEIGNSAFEGCTMLISINVPKSLEQLGYSAFKECKNIHELILPERMETIGEEAFMNSGIEYIKIPTSVHWIGRNAFKGTDELRWVYFENIGDWYTTVDGKYQKIPDDLANERMAALCLQKYVDSWSNGYGKG